MSFTKSLDELGSILAEMVARAGEEQHIDTCRRLEKIEKIVRQNWPEQLREAKRERKRRNAEPDPAERSE